MTQGFVHSLIIFIFSAYLFEGKPLLKDGQNSDFWSYSNLLYTSIIMVANIWVFLLGKQIPILQMVFIGCSVTLYVVYAFVSAEFMYSKTWFSYTVTFRSVMIWLVLLFVCGTYYLVFMLIKTFWLWVFPTCYTYFWYLCSIWWRDFNENEISELKRLHRNHFKKYKADLLKVD